METLAFSSPICQQIAQVSGMMLTVAETSPITTGLLLDSPVVSQVTLQSAIDLEEE